jgi:hypothetical protein
MVVIWSARLSPKLIHYYSLRCGVKKKWVREYILSVPPFEIWLWGSKVGKADRNNCQ